MSTYEPSKFAVTPDGMIEVYAEEIVRQGVSSRTSRLTANA
jgi:hypothetical protein